MKRISLILIIILSALCQTADVKAITLRDSLMNELRTEPSDSLRMRSSYVFAQNYMDRFWALDLLEVGIETAIRVEHKTWEMALRGAKVRWAHRHHDWVRMDKYLDEQRKAAFRLGEFGNYLGQVAQSILVMNGMGRFEKSRELYELMKKDAESAGEETVRKLKAYKYIVEADYHSSLGDKKKSADIYLNALADTTMLMSSEQRISFYTELMKTFISLHRHTEALEYADSILNIHYSYSIEKQNLPGSRATIMEVFLCRAQVYEHIGDIAKMHENILTAETYAGVMAHNQRASIYKMWRQYYNATGDYKHALEFIDKAMREYMEDGYNEEAIQLEIEKAGPMWKMGQREEAVELYRTLLEKMDLMHQNLISGQQDFLDEQTEILHQQQRSVTFSTWTYNVMMVFVLVVAVGVLLVLIYGITTLMKMRKNHKITRRKLRQAKAADNAKEVFLRNITTLINEPLQHVVHDAKQLSTDKTLSPEQQQEIVHHSKKHVAKLMALVNNVLDLSRLEACMMKYTLQEADMVALAEQAVNEFNEENAAEKFDIVDNVENVDNVDNIEKAPIVTLDKQVDSFVKQSDVTRFTTMLKTLFSSPVDHPERKAESIKVTLTEQGGRLLVSITGSLFADESDFTEAERMTNTIHRYFMRDFGGAYDVNNERILITIIK